MAARSAHFQRFRRDYLSRVRSERGRDHSEYILSALRGAKSDDDRWDIRHTLINELVRVGRLSDAEKLMIEDVKQEPDNPLPLMSLATHYQYSDRLQEAKSYIGRAVAAAKRTRTFGYNTLGQQARVAIAARDWRLLAQTLKDMTAYRHRTGNADCFPEAEFLDRIPIGAVPGRVVEAYKRRRDYLSAIGYSTLYGRRGKAPSNSSVQLTRKKPRAADRKR